MKFQHIAAAALVAVAAAGAHATTTVWGPHTTTPEFGFGFASGPSATILDYFTFTLSAPSTLTTTAVSNESAFLDLVGGTVGLYSGVVATGTLIGSFAFNSTSVSLTTTGLAAGSYYYRVTATVAPAAFGGSYALTSQVSAVPEPETYALMLAGLGAGLFLSMRRRGV